MTILTNDNSSNNESNNNTIVLENLKSSIKVRLDGLISGFEQISRQESVLEAKNKSQEFYENPNVENLLALYDVLRDIQSPRSKERGTDASDVGIKNETLAEIIKEIEHVFGNDELEFEDYSPSESNNKKRKANCEPDGSTKKGKTPKSTVATQNAPKEDVTASTASTTFTTSTTSEQSRDKPKEQPPEEINEHPKPNYKALYHYYHLLMQMSGTVLDEMERKNLVNTLDEFAIFLTEISDKKYSEVLISLEVFHKNLKIILERIVQNKEQVDEILLLVAQTSLAFRIPAGLFSEALISKCDQKTMEQYPVINTILMSALEFKNECEKYDDDRNLEAIAFIEKQRSTKNEDSFDLESFQESMLSLADADVPEVVTPSALKAALEKLRTRNSEDASFNNNLKLKRFYEDLEFIFAPGHENILKELGRLYPEKRTSMFEKSHVSKAKEKVDSPLRGALANDLSALNMKGGEVSPKEEKLKAGSENLPLKAGSENLPANLETLEIIPIHMDTISFN